MHFHSLTKYVCTMLAHYTKEALLDAMGAKDNFQGKTPGTWQRFLPKLLKLLDASKDEVQEAREKANPFGLDMQPVYT